MSIHNKVEVPEGETHGANYTRDRFGRNHGVSQVDGQARLRRRKKIELKVAALFLTTVLLAPETGFCGQKSHPLHRVSHSGRSRALSARSYVVVNASNGRILYSKNPDLKLPPASTAKVMTVLIARERLSMEGRVVISRRAVNMAPSKAGLTMGAGYTVQSLITAALVSSSNDAAVALAEAVSGSEINFAKLMNAKARQLGMKNTCFVNATGLTEKKRKQYTTAYDLTTLIRQASKDRFLDDVMGLARTTITGSDGKPIVLNAHNKMLWRMPKFVKGKTGWTNASRHTFVGTNYSADKSIAFAMLSSKKPWADIKRLASFGISLERRR